jgi:hypothetical protein
VCLQSPKLFGKKGEEDDSGSWECLYTSTAVAHATKEQCAMGVITCRAIADAELVMLASKTSKPDENGKAMLAAADSVWTDLTMDQKIAMCTAQDDDFPKVSSMCQEHAQELQQASKYAAAAHALAADLTPSDTAASSDVRGTPTAAPSTKPAKKAAKDASKVALAPSVAPTVAPSVAPSLPSLLRTGHKQFLIAAENEAAAARAKQTVDYLKQGLAQAAAATPLPTPAPSVAPTIAPTLAPTEVPTSKATQQPSLATTTAPLSTKSDSKGSMCENPAHFQALKPVDPSSHFTCVMLETKIMGDVHIKSWGEKDCAMDARGKPLKQQLEFYRTVCCDGHKTICDDAVLPTKPPTALPTAAPTPALPTAPPTGVRAAMGDGLHGLQVTAYTAVDAPAVPPTVPSTAPPSGPPIPSPCSDSYSLHACNELQRQGICATLPKLGKKHCRLTCGFCGEQASKPATSHLRAHRFSDASATESANAHQMAMRVAHSAGQKGGASPTDWIGAAAATVSVPAFIFHESN